MLQRTNFQHQAQLVLNWVNRYFARLNDLPVKSQVKPKEIYHQLPPEAPALPESIEQILADIDKIVVPGITHWQHPNFHAYFPGNSSVESMLGELVTSAFGAQCMMWETSPAAAELEQRVMEWLRDETGLPRHWEGVIQDSASSSTLTAMLTAREVCTGFQSNLTGVPQNLRIYCSEQAHSSVEKAVGVCGIGRNNLRKIGVDDQMRMNPLLLNEAIEADIRQGFVPCMVVAAIGTTGTVSVDPLKEIAEVCKAHKVWLHVDAAYAGTALLLPEYRWMIDGIEQVDSMVFNPHKWMFTAFDCSAYYVKGSSLLIKTFDILPEYLKTATRGLVNDYKDWGIPLGRRFRALKLWFVIRCMGTEGLRARIREQISLAEYCADRIAQSPSIEIVRKPFLGFVCFRYLKPDASDEELNRYNQQQLQRLNDGGKVFLSHTKIDNRYIIRLHTAQTYTTQADIDLTVEEIRSCIDR